MKEAQAIVYGAVSIVNAIGTGRGATLGTSLSTVATVSASSGSGIVVNTANQSPQLMGMTVRNIVPRRDLERYQIDISIETHTPTGCGLKSSSATSTAVSMACAKLFNPEASEKEILYAGVDAAIRSGVSMTGAYDDVCGCYYGGINITDNTAKSLVKRLEAPHSMVAVIFVPNERRRHNVRSLRRVSALLDKCWHLAKNGYHWDAMIMNGLAVSSILGPNPQLLNELLQEGAIAASLSGNGPAIAALARSGEERTVQRVFTDMDGRVIISPLSNRKAECHEL